MARDRNSDDLAVHQQTMPLANWFRDGGWRFRAGGWWFRAGGWRFRAGGWRRALPWLIGVVGFVIAARKLVDGYGDLGICLDTAREFRERGIDLFRARPDSGPWAYPHFAVLPFAGLQAVLDDTAIRWLYCVLLGAGAASIVLDTMRFVRPLGGLRAWQWLAFGLLFQRCLAQNMTHGQLSLFVAVGVARGTVELQRGRDGRAGVWLALAAALKITPGLFLLALLPMRRPRAAAVMAAVAAAAILLVPWPFCGTDEHLRHLSGLGHVLTGSITDPDSVSIVQHYGGPGIRGTLDYLLQPRALDPAGNTTNFIALSDGALLAVKLAWSALIAAVLAAWFFAVRARPDPIRIAHQAAATMLAMSLFSPLLRVYHLSAAMLAFALFCRGPRGRRDVLWSTTALGLLFAMTLRQRNLLGEALWRALDVGGLLHFALIGLLVWLWLDARKGPTTTP